MLLFLSLSVGIHGFEVDVAEESTVASKLRRGFRTPAGVSGDRYGALCKVPFKEETAANWRDGWNKFYHDLSPYVGLFSLWRSLRTPGMRRDSLIKLPVMKD